jgi:hypothetical protein
MGLGGGYAASIGAKQVTEDKHNVWLSMGEWSPLGAVVGRVWERHEKTACPTGGQADGQGVAAIMMTVMGLKFARSYRFFPAGISKFILH